MAPTHAIYLNERGGSLNDKLECNLLIRKTFGPLLFSHALRHESDFTNSMTNELYPRRVLINNKDNKPNQNYIFRIYVLRIYLYKD